MTSFASEVAYTLGQDVVSNLYAAAEKRSVTRWQSGHHEAKAELHKLTYMLASIIRAITLLWLRLLQAIMVTCSQQ